MITFAANTQSGQMYAKSFIRGYNVGYAVRNTFDTLLFSSRYTTMFKVLVTGLLIALMLFVLVLTTQSTYAMSNVAYNGAGNVIEHFVSTPTPIIDPTLQDTSLELSTKCSNYPIVIRQITLSADNTNVTVTFTDGDETFTANSNTIYLHAGVAMVDCSKSTHNPTITQDHITTTLFIH